MGMWVGRGRKARRCYGFDEIALVPGEVTVNPNEVDSSWQFAGKKYLRKQYRSQCLLTLVYPHLGQWLGELFCALRACLLILRQNVVPGQHYHRFQKAGVSCLFQSNR